jgi:hypothetical protein
MAAYSTEQQIFITDWYILSSESPKKGQKSVPGIKINIKVRPDGHTVSNLINKFCKTGSLLDDYSLR